MKKMIFVSVLFTVANTVYCQQVIATAGNHHQQSNGSVTYTVGELVTETFTGGSLTMTQGFNQPVISVVALNEELLPDMQLYPNPTSDFVILKLKQENSESLYYSIYDMNGKLLESQAVKADQTEIAFQRFAPASYIFKVHDKNKDIKSFKIVKQ